MRDDGFSDKSGLAADSETAAVIIDQSHLLFVEKNSLAILPHQRGPFYGLLGGSVLFMYLLLFCHFDCHYHNCLERLETVVKKCFSKVINIR